MQEPHIKSRLIGISGLAESSGLSFLLEAPRSNHGCSRSEHFEDSSAEFDELGNLLVLNLLVNTRDNCLTRGSPLASEREGEGEREREAKGEREREREREGSPPPLPLYISPTDPNTYRFFLSLFFYYFFLLFFLLLLFLLFFLLLFFLLLFLLLLFCFYIFCYFFIIKSVVVVVVHALVLDVGHSKRPLEI